MSVQEYHPAPYAKVPHVRKLNDLSNERDTGNVWDD